MWREFNGRELNPGAMGYSSLEGFLRAIPDVVEVRKTPQGKFVYVGIADKSTQHIKNMVSAQKDSNKR